VDPVRGIGPYERGESIADTGNPRVPILRKDLPANELESLYARLERQLNRIGVETQPKVAARLLELAQSSDAQIKDYHDAIRTDAAISARVLRLANSAFYAQRQPVTRLERALIIIGIERTKAVSLGFYLSRAAAGEGARRMSRKVWGKSVYRASLAMSMARTTCPHLAPEAFIVGLMMDCGQPIMARLLGEPYERLHARHANPHKLHAAEYAELEFTHADVVTALMRRWKIPGLLARPICSHHVAPPVGKTVDPCGLLHRLAFYVGAVQLDEASSQPTNKTPMSTIAQRLFEVLPTDLESVVRSTGDHYQDLVGVFAEIGDSIGSAEDFSDTVQNQLVEIMDEQMQRAVKAESRGGTERLEVCGQQIEVEPGSGGEVIAYINAADGQRMISCTVSPLSETPESVGRLLGLDEAPEEHLVELMRVMQHMAA
jgi:HD-like signal output (HDOD) protein